MKLILVSLAPVFIIAVYVYFRDKYEKEPIALLLKSLGVGILIVIPIILAETLLTEYGQYFYGLENAAYTAFVVAAFTEEAFKYIGVYLLVWKNRNFNEKFNGIVYATFISMGFATIENIMYVTRLGVDIGFARAFTAVPAHALFGVLMGYYLGLARFYPKTRVKNLMLALFVPILFHGFYDFILMSDQEYLLGLFIPFLVYLLITGLKRMKKISDSSIFRK